MDGQKAKRPAKKRGPPKGARNFTRWDAAKQQDRENEALNYRRAGLTYDEIGKALTEPCTFSAARKLVFRALERTRVDVGEDVRALELSRLDRLTRRPYLAAISKDTPREELPGLTATVVSLMTRRAKLLGLDSPIEVKLEQAIRAYEQDVLDVVRANVPAEAFDRITAALARLGGVGGGGEGTGEEGASPAPTQH